MLTYTRGAAPLALGGGLALAGGFLLAALITALWTSSSDVVAGLQDFLSTGVFVKERATAVADQVGQVGTAFGSKAFALFNKLPAPIREQLTTSLTLAVTFQVIAAIGGALYFLYFWVRSRVEFMLARYCQVSVTIDSYDEQYDNILDYIGTSCRVETGNCTASTKARKNASFQERVAQWLGGKMKVPTIHYQPEIDPWKAASFAWVDSKKREHTIHVHRWVEKPMFASKKQGRNPESVTFTIWWTTDRRVLQEFMNSALKSQLEEVAEGTISIYVKNMWLPIWSKAVQKEKRSRDTVILDESLAGSVIEDMQHFFTEKQAQWYHSAGIPYRRGYLLYGAPGCGKTSFAQVLAGELGLDMCLMNLSNQKMDDDDLAELLRNAPPKSMLLLEDVDAVFVQRAKSDTSRNGISFSGLLNALDGAAAQEGCVILMTTNHKDRLDEALIRPGRCDVHVKIEKASQLQAQRMFNRFFAQDVAIENFSEGLVELAPGTGLDVKTGAELKYKLTRKSVRCGGVVGGPALPSDFLGHDTTVYARRVTSSSQGISGLSGALNSVSGDHGLAGSSAAGITGLAKKTASTKPGGPTRYLALYRSAEEALKGGYAGLIRHGIATEGSSVHGALFASRLQEQLSEATRFGSRIPDGQVSMAKLQGYLMRQKLNAETTVKQRLFGCGAGAPSGTAEGLLSVSSSAEKKKSPLEDHVAVGAEGAGSGGGSSSSLGASSAEKQPEEERSPTTQQRVGAAVHADFKAQFEAEVAAGAIERSVMNVHELLEVNEAEGAQNDGSMSLYAHLRRVGLQDYAAKFEYFGAMTKKDLTVELVAKVAAVDAELNVGGPRKDRLLALIQGGAEIDKQYRLADLSVLRDRFLAAFHNVKSLPEKLVLECLSRANSRVSQNAGDQIHPYGPRAGATSALRRARNVNATLDHSTRMLELAHAFQEILEHNGKTTVSMYQLDMHLCRYANDPIAAVDNAHLLVRERVGAERAMRWMTTFEFLRRLGSAKEEHAFALEDGGYKFWHEWKALDKTALTDVVRCPAKFTEKDAEVVIAVSQASAERADLMRMFQLVEFGDLKAQFRARFPDAEEELARKFALALTDEAGVAKFSVLQIAEYLAGFSDSDDDVEASCGAEAGIVVPASGESPATAGNVSAESPTISSEGPGSKTAPAWSGQEGSTCNIAAGVVVTGAGKATTSTDASACMRAIAGIGEKLVPLEAAEKARVRPAAPAPPAEPTEEVYVWLKEKGLKQHWPCFQEQEIVTIELLSSILWSHADLEKIGIAQFGARCKLVSELTKLASSNTSPSASAGSVVEDEAEENAGLGAGSSDADEKEGHSPTSSGPKEAASTCAASPEESVDGSDV